MSIFTYILRCQKTWVCYNQQKVIELSNITHPSIQFLLMNKKNSARRIFEFFLCFCQLFDLNLTKSTDRVLFSGPQTRVQSGPIFPKGPWEPRAPSRGPTGPMANPSLPKPWAIVGCFFMIFIIFWNSSKSRKRQQTIVCRLFMILVSWNPSKSWKTHAIVCVTKPWAIVGCFFHDFHHFLKFIKIAKNDRL